MAIKSNMYKNGLMVGLVAAALTLSACGKKDEPPMETDPAVDAQAPVEQEAVGANDDVAVASANDINNDTDTVVMTDDEIMNDDVAVAIADDEAEVMDGSDSEEHVSTY